MTNQAPIFFSVYQKKHTFTTCEMSGSATNPNSYTYFGPSGGAEANFNSFFLDGSSVFGASGTRPYLSPLLTRFNPSQTLMKLFTDGDRIIQITSDGSGTKQFVTTEDYTTGDSPITGSSTTSNDGTITFTYTGDNAYKAFYRSLSAAAPFRGYFMLMDLISIAIWVGVVLGINRKMKIPLPVVALAMAVDQLDIIFLTMVAYKAVKP